MKKFFTTYEYKRIVFSVLVSSVSRNLIFIRRILKELILISLLSVLALTSSSQNRDSFTIYVFLLDECRICQEVSPELRKIAEIALENSIGMVGYFPNFATTEGGMQKFVKKQKINFPVFLDHDKKIAARFSATVLPEVVVWNETKQEIFYRGAINNLFFAPGKRRHHISQNYLQDAIFAVQNGVLPVNQNTEPIGCLINYSENRL